LKSWVVLAALDALNSVTAVIGYCNKACSLALALYFNLLFHIFNDYSYIYLLYRYMERKSDQMDNEAQDASPMCQGRVP
jgi:hypothetical protein